MHLLCVPFMSALPEFSTQTKDCRGIFHLLCVSFGVVPYAGMHMTPQTTRSSAPLAAPNPEPAALRDVNLSSTDRRVLGLVFRNHSLIQNQIIEETGLVQQSVSRLVTGLVERGCLVAGERVSSGRRGYPSQAFRMAPDFGYSLGLSIMADAVSLSLTDFSGHARAEWNHTFPTMGIDRVLDWVNARIDEVRSMPGIDSTRLLGMGVGIAGSFANGIKGFNTPTTLEEWAFIDVADLLSKATDLPTWADNDGNLAALGENMTGVGRRYRSFAYIYFSTGVGGGLVIDREVWRGRSGNAGEFAGGLPGNIYPFPNLELLRQLINRDGAQFATVAELLKQFDVEHPAVEDWIARIRDSVSIIASNATAILDVDAIVFGGRMPKSLAEKLIPRVELFDQMRYSKPRPMAELVPAEATGDATAIGAAVLPLAQQCFA